MRKIPLPEENRRRAEKLFDGDSDKKASRFGKVNGEGGNALNNPSHPTMSGALPKGEPLSRFEKIKKPPTMGEVSAELTERAESIHSLGGGTIGGEEGDSIENHGYPDNDYCDKIIKKAAKKSAREYALLLVSTHTYTEKGLFQKIKSKKVYSDEEINEALEYVKGFGYINDLRLAENTVPRLAEKCFGRSKICRYLASKGIDEDIIDSLDFSEIDFVYYCKRLLDRHRGKPDDKIMRALLNAGYTYEEISEAKRMK